MLISKQTIVGSCNLKNVTILIKGRKIAVTTFEMYFIVLGFFYREPKIFLIVVISVSCCFYPVRNFHGFVILRISVIRYIQAELNVLTIVDWFIFYGLYSVFQ